jgi:sulfide:quinone oxidoreductase
VVAGGGIGGIVAARTLRKLLPRQDRVILVERDPDFWFTPSLLWIVEGSRTAQRITRSRDGLTRRGIEVVTGEVTRIDPEGRALHVGAREVGFDGLVVALGARTDPAALQGFSETVIDLYSPEGARRAGEALRALDGGRVAILVSSLPYKCPAAPWEAAFLADSVLRRSGLRSRVSIDVFTPEPYPMPTAGEEVGAALLALVRERGIEVHTGSPVERIEPSRRLVTPGGSHAFDLLLGVPPHSAPDAARSSGLSGPTGYIQVQADTLQTEVEGVYAVGDVTQIPIAGGKFLPKAGVFAHEQAKVAAFRLAAQLRGVEPQAHFDGKGACFMEMGNGVAGYATGTFYGRGGPAVRMRRPGRRWHLSKVWFERWWMARWL